MGVDTRKHGLAFWGLVWRDHGGRGKFHLSQKDFTTLCGVRVENMGAIAGTPQTRPEFATTSCSACEDLCKEKSLTIVPYNKAWKLTGHKPVDVEMEVL